jgi:hypothetical protein
MRFTSSKAASRRGQQGFALMMVMLLTTLVLLGAIVAAPYVRTERQREKEEEMIWRGKQYVRGIKLYYRKNGRFPTSVDDLIKPKVGSVRYMRQAYKDPMNKEDGAWRMIYVGPAGQLIGSLKPPQTFQIPGMAGTQPGAPAGTNAQQPNNFGLSGFGQSNTPKTNSAQGPTNGPTNTPAGGQSSAAPADDAANATPSGLVNSDSPLIGGNIIGVGSKINKRSVIVYDKAKNYRLFEFVWNPSKDLANALNQAGAQPVTPNPNPKGSAPTGFGQSGFAPAAPAPAPTNPPNDPNEMPMPSPPPNPPQL